MPGPAWRLSELLQEFDHRLLVLGAELAERPNDLARVTPVGLRGRAVIGRANGVLGGLTRQAVGHVGDLVWHRTSGARRARRIPIIGGGQVVELDGGEERII